MVYSLGYSVWLNWLIRITIPLLSLCWLLKTCSYSFPNYSWLVMYIRTPVCKIVLLNLFMYIASTQSVLWSPSDGYFRSSPFVIFNSSFAVILLLSDLFHSAVCNHITCLLFRIVYNCVLVIFSSCNIIIYMFMHGYEFEHGALCGTL